MTKRTLLLLAAGCVVGCVPESFTTPAFPPVPEQAAKSTPEKSKTEERGKPPVTPTQVSDRNAKKVLADLDAELEAAIK